MQKYIALLRGVNVGGKNILSMAKLKIAFEENDLRDVRTYINSGNIIFSSETDNETKLKELCESIIADRFHLTIPVAIISAVDLTSALCNTPEWWDNEKESKHNAIFVLSPATPQTLVEQVGDINPEYEQIAYSGQVIFWSAPIKTFSRTRFLRIVGTSAYQNVTIRNANTTKKLLELIK